MRGHFCCSHEGEIVTLVLDKVNTLHAAGIAGLEQNVPDTLEIIVKAVLDGPCTPCRGDQRIRARRTGDLGAFRRRLKAVADRLELRRAQPSHNTFPPLSSFGPICLCLYPIAKHAHTPPASVLGGAGSTARPNEQQRPTKAMILDRRPDLQDGGYAKLRFQQWRPPPRRLYHLSQATCRRSRISKKTDRSIQDQGMSKTSKTELVFAGPTCRWLRILPNSWFINLIDQQLISNRLQPTNQQNKKQS